MNEAFKVQAQIRENAKVIQDFSADLSRWEGLIKAKDTELKAKKDGSAPPPPRSAFALSSSKSAEKTSTPAKASASGSAADHTYDKGYKKWNIFDIDAALQEIDDGTPSAKSSAAESSTVAMPQVPAPTSAVPPIVATIQQQQNDVPLTPGTIIAPSVPSKQAGDSQLAAIPDATLQMAKPRDVMERERGNEYFSKGNMNQAVKFYTRSIGFNPCSVPAYSNRAMALIKLKDFERANSDCCAALELDGKHVKSLMRRGTARNSLGHHTAALIDFLHVQKLEPGNKQAAAQCVKTRELIKSSVRRAPRRSVPVHGLPSKENNTHNAKIVSRDVKTAKPGTKSEPRVSKTALQVAEALVAQAPKEEQQRQQQIPKEPAGNELVRQNNSLAAAKAAKIQDKSFLLEQSPKTSYEFERVWKELKGDTALQWKLLTERLGGVGVAKVFSRTTPEPDTFLEIVKCLAGSLDLQSEENRFSKAAQVLESVGSVSGMKMTLMFLAADDKEQVKNLVNRLEENGSNAKLRQAFRC